MPPRPKFTKDEVIQAALELVSEKGMEALTSRDLGARLGSSARPIFTVFANMEELHREVRAAALLRFEEYAEKANQYTPAFKQFGMQMILFSMEEPKLYQLLFMSENAQSRSWEDVYADLGETADTCVGIIQRDYCVSEQDAKILFRHLWIHTFAIGALCASHMCQFSEGEINELLGQEFMAMMVYIKSGNLHRRTPHPELRTDE